MNEILAHAILDYCERQRDAMLALLRRLALVESPSLLPEAQDPVFALLGGKLGELDYVVRRWRGRHTGGVLYARPARRTRQRPVQLLLGHSDTVWPVGTLASMPVVLEDNRLAGPGVFDMKAGLVQMLFALEALRALDLQPALAPVVLVNSDEEIGSPESSRVVRRLAQLAARAFVMEPALGADGRLKTARKGVMRFDVRITGKAAHAGLAPEEGISAILELSYAIQKLAALNDPGRGITVNVGVVSGGTRANVVAHESRAQVDVRVPTVGDAGRVATAIQGMTNDLPGARVEVELVRSALPLERTPRNRRLWEMAQQVGGLLGVALEEASAGGASDGNTTSQLTATLDGLGAVGDGAHAAHEFVYVDKLPERAALLALLLLME